MSVLEAPALSKIDEWTHALFVEDESEDDVVPPGLRDQL